MRTLSNIILRKESYKPLLTYKCPQKNQWKPFYQNDLLQYTNFCFYQLQQLNLKKNDRILYKGKNSIEWLAWNMASNAMGCIWVPMYEQQHDEYYKHIIQDCNPKLAIVDDPKKWKHNSVKSISNYIEHETYYNPIKKCEENEIATIIYTSGTTGKSKGVTLTNENILINTDSIHNIYHDVIDMKSLNVLPWAHIYGQTCELYYNLIYNNETILCSNKNKFLQECRLFQPTVLFLVPFVLEQIKSKLNIFDKPGVSWMIPSLLEQILGKNIKMIFVGGAAITKETLNFFTKNGICICQGYGMTETSPMVSLNHWTSPRNENSVGFILDNVHVKIVNDEIHVKGESVMKGYWNELPLSSKEWYQTGDLGYVDDNFLFYTGRKSENFKLSNGKFINVNKLEKKIKINLPNANFIICYQNGICLISDKKVKLDVINKGLKQHEKIEHLYYISPQELKEKYMTPKMSIKRNLLQKHFLKNQS